MRCRFRRPVTFFVITCILCGCPHHFQPAAAPVVSSSDERANQQFARARQLFDDGSYGQADAAFEQLIRSFPEDRLVALAMVYRGRIAFKAGKLEQARDRLRGPASLPQEDEVGQQARYFFGLTQIRLGAQDEGYRLLAPFAAKVSDEDRPEVLIALAHAAKQLKEPLKAANHLQELFDLTTRPVEKLYARTHLTSIVDSSLSVAQLRTLYALAPADSLLAALTGKRLAALETASGNQKEAKRILDATSEARTTFGISPQQGGLASACNPRIVGLLVPFSGRYSAAGQMLLSGATAASMIDDRITLAIRDSSADAAAAVRDLVVEDKVCSLVGTLNPASAAAAAREAATNGVPFISLARVDTSASMPQLPCQILPDNQKRTASLAQYAIKRQQLRRFAMVSPDNGYGAAMSKTFARIIAQQGRTIVARLTYPPGTTSFTDIAESLSKHTFDALFVPDTANSLALLAPALARAGLWSGTTSRSRSVRGQPERRQFQLLSTADGLSDRLIQSAGRYIRGAVLAPGFFPDETAPQSGAFARRFRNRRGRPPGLVEALAHDAVELIRALVDQGALGSSTLTARLQAGKGIVGLTGIIHFGTDGHRLDPPPLYRVNMDRIETVGGRR